MFAATKFRDQVLSKLLMLWQLVCSEKYLQLAITIRHLQTFPKMFARKRKKLEFSILNKMCCYWCYYYTIINNAIVPVLDCLRTYWNFEVNIHTVLMQFVVSIFALWLSCFYSKNIFICIYIFGEEYTLFIGWSQLSILVSYTSLYMQIFNNCNQLF